MVKIQISIDLDVNEPERVGAQLAAILQGARMLIAPPNSVESVEPVAQDIALDIALVAPATAPEPNGAAPATKHRGKPGRPPKSGKARTTKTPAPALLNPKSDWDFFDSLVRNEMRRLSVDRRMPGTALWNNERDCRLPTMAGLVAAYDVADVKELATKLGMPAPLSTMAAGG